VLIIFLDFIIIIPIEFGLILVSIIWEENLAGKDSYLFISLYLSELSL